MSKALGQPPLMLIDLRPIRPPMVIVGSHEIAEQISKASKLFPYSIPKMPQGYDHMVHIIGPTSILASDVRSPSALPSPLDWPCAVARSARSLIHFIILQGEEWKRLRKRFNVGFAPQHLITLLPCILEKSFAFLGHLDKFARTGQSFSLVSLTGNLTFDIITSVVMDSDFRAQNGDQPHGFIRAFRDLFETYTSEQIELPWIFAPRVEWTRRRLARQIRSQLKAIVCDAFANQAEDTTTRSILSLSFQDVSTLTTQVVDEACDQLSTFLFAGHDTTSVLLSYMIYELGCTPHALKALRDELDSVFSPGRQH
jgi:cytochrome P450